MKSLILAVVAGAAALSFGTGAASASSNAERAPVVWRSGDVQLAPSVFDPADGSVLLEKAQWIWGGRNYCWYINGWRGPGYYWCGYAWRRGYGWGGPVGWHGWRGGGYHGGGGHGGGFHGGGFHGGGGHGGGGHGGGGHGGGEHGGHH